MRTTSKMMTISKMKMGSKRKTSLKWRHPKKWRQPQNKDNLNNGEEIQKEDDIVFCLYSTREAIVIKMSQKCGKSPKGGGVGVENQKVHNSKCRLFWDEGRGVWIFRFFLNLNDWNVAWILLYMGEILVRYG